MPAPYHVAVARVDERDAFLCAPRRNAATPFSERTPWRQTD